MKKPKEVTLTPEQCAYGQEIASQEAREMAYLAGLTKELASASQLRSDGLWNKIAKALGYDSMAAVRQDGCFIVVNWITGKAQIKRNENAE